MLLRKETQKKARETKPNVLVIGSTFRNSVRAYNLLLESCEALGFTCGEEDRGSFTLDRVTVGDLSTLFKPYEYVIADGINWSTLFPWARYNRNNIGYLIASEEVESEAASPLSYLGETQHVALEH